MDRESQQTIWQWMGACLRRAREARGWSQTTLGQQVGLGQSAISRIEHGAGAGYPLATYVALTRVLGLSWVALLEATVAPPGTASPPRCAPHEPHAVLLSLAYILLLW